MSSWEDELSTARPTSSKTGISHDPFDDSSDFVAPVLTSSSSVGRIGGGSSASENVFESDPLSSPLMKAPIYTSEALHASIRTNRSLSASQKSLKDSLLAARKINQDQKIQQQLAVHPEEVDGDDQEAQELVARLEKKKTDTNKAQGIQSIPALPSLTDLQKELLSVVSQAEPPPRTLQIVPLESRMSRWIEEGSELSIEELDSRLRLLHSQYLDSRPHARADTRRMWNSQQRLHEMSVKLASIHSLSDMATLENQLFAQESAHTDDANKSADPTFVDPNSYFYDLYSLDRESYADLKHLHSSSIVDAVQVDAEGGVSTGWWRTQLSELDEDWSERRKRDAEVFRKLEEEAVGYIEGEDSIDINDSMLGEHKQRDIGSAYDRVHGSAPELNGGFLLGRRRAAEEAIAAGSSMTEDDLLASDRRAALAALDGAGGRNGGEAAVKRLTRDQLMARTQGRSFLSLSKGTDVILPPGQRLLRPGERPQGESTEQSKVLDEIEDAFREDASVKKPQRKYGSHY